MVWASNKESLIKVGEICGTSPTNLIRDCLSRCMLVVMTTYACKKGQQDISDDQLQQASSSHDLLVEYFGENVSVDTQSAQLCVILVLVHTPKGRVQSAAGVDGGLHRELVVEYPRVSSGGVRVQQVFQVM